MGIPLNETPQTHPTPREGSVQSLGTLTDKEREAIEQAIDTANGMAQIESWALCTLRSLLERLHT
jgi:hypothetical protein